MCIFKLIKDIKKVAELERVNTLLQNNNDFLNKKIKVAEECKALWRHKAEELDRKVRQLSTDHDYYMHSVNSECKRAGMAEKELATLQEKHRILLRDTLAMEAFVTLAKSK